MAVRHIFKQGDDVLAKKCHTVTVFDEKLHKLLDDMKDTMNSANGVGLAAPQIGILRRIVVVLDIDTEEIYEMINPEIITTSGTVEDLEGCLSVPGVYGYVTRPEKVKVRAQDRNGKVYEIERTGMTARCFCHETDHLQGHLFTEKVSEYVDPEDIDN